MLSGGFIFALLVECFLYSILNNYKKIKDDRIKQISVIYLISIILLCNFDLLLFTNNFVISLLLWLIIMLPITIYNFDFKEISS